MGFSVMDLRGSSVSSALFKILWAGPPPNKSAPTHPETKNKKQNKNKKAVAQASTKDPSCIKRRQGRELFFHFQKPQKCVFVFCFCLPNGHTISF